jgi:hypothetical protein
MMDYKEIVAWLLDLGQHEPDLLSLIVGGAVALGLTLVLERYFLERAIDDAAKRRQKGGTFLFYWAVSAVAAAGLWWALDPADSWSVRIVVCVIVEPLPFFGYPFLGAFLTEKFPDLGSAWRTIHPDE